MGSGNEGALSKTSFAARLQCAPHNNPKNGDFVQTPSCVTTSNRNVALEGGWRALVLYILAKSSHLCPDPLAMAHDR